jgi:hypothetical protein
MGTRSVTRIHINDINSPILVAIYQQFDGYFEGVGDELKNFLDGYVIINGIGVNIPEKSANGMGCLAAQLIKYLKTDIGGTYIVPTHQEEEYLYDIFIKNNDLCLTGKSRDGEENKVFELKDA